jgi:hypothetical protein
MSSAEPTGHLTPTPLLPDLTTTVICLRAPAFQNSAKMVLQQPAGQPGGAVARQHTRPKAAEAEDADGPFRRRVDAAAARAEAQLATLLRAECTEAEPETGRETEGEGAQTDTQMGGGKPGAGVSIELVHVSHPEGGGFSRGKKQCDLWEFVWGASLMLADLLTVSQLPCLCGSSGERAGGGYLTKARWAAGGGLGRSRWRGLQTGNVGGARAGARLRRGALLAGAGDGRRGGVPPCMQPPTLSAP